MLWKVISERIKGPALLSALLLIIAFPNFNLSLFAWVGLIPLFFAIEGKKTSAAFSAAYLTGTIFFLGTAYWLIHVTLPGMVGVVLYLALYFGVFGIIVSPAVIKPSYLSLFIIPSVWIALEYARSHFLGGFGWNLLAHSQSYDLPVIQIADITGGYGVSFLIVLVNTAIFFTIKDLKNKRYSTFYLAVAIVCLFLVIGYGKFRLNNVFVGERLKIALVQGNIAQKRKWDPAFRREIIEKYESLTMAAAKEGPDLIIWPETSVPGFLRSEQDLFLRVTDLSKSAGAALLVGTPRQDIADEDAYYNSAALFDKTGKLIADYDKVHLVPFGEFIPAKWLFSFVEKFTKSTIGDFSSGKEYTVFKFFIERELNEGTVKRHLMKNVKFSAMICFEDIFPDIAREFVNNGAKFLVNITNDAWFGASCAPYQHAQSSVFRAVENRVNVVRAANSGLSCFIDQKGRIFSAVRSGSGKDIFVDGYKVDDIVLANTRTFYTAYGDLFAYLCIVISLLYTASVLMARRKASYR